MNTSFTKEKSFFFNFSKSTKTAAKKEIVRHAVSLTNVETAITMISRIKITCLFFCKYLKVRRHPER